MHPLLTGLLEIARRLIGLTLGLHGLVVRGIIDLWTVLFNRR